MTVRTLSTTEAKNSFSAIINSVAKQDESVVVAQHGRPTAAIISMDDFEGLQQWKEQQRRNDVLRQLRELRREVRAKNKDLTDEQAMELADRFVRETIDEMIAEGKLRYEGYERETGGGASRRSRHERADQSLAFDGRRQHS